MAGERCRQDGCEESRREESRETSGGKKNDKIQTPRESTKIAKAAPAAALVESLKGAVQREMPLAVQPMLAVSTEKPFNDKDWLIEIKWDGYRAVSFIQDGKVRLGSRN